MTKNNLIEQNLILNYIKDNITTIPDNYKEFLIRYAISKSTQNPNEIYSVNKDNFLRDIKTLSESYIECNNTSLAAKRMANIIQLLTTYNSELTQEELIDLSLELDKIFIESGLPVRNTDSMLQKIKTNSKGSR